MIPVSMLQGAGFTGAATGVNLARDIEQGWFDRLLASPAPRPALLAGLVVSASLRALIPATVLLTVGFAIGVDWPGIRRPAARVRSASWRPASSPPAGGSRWRSSYKTQSAAPLMQAGMFVLVLFTTAYAPLELLQGWLADIAADQPADPGGRGGPARVRRRADHLGRRPGPALVALAGLLAVLTLFALRGMRRTAD